jgi:FkbM family methyltransferase
LAHRKVKSVIRRAIAKSFRAMLFCVSFDTKIYLSKAILNDCGFGSGGSFDWITSSAPLLLDVGAHRGEYTCSFLKRFPRGRAICIEPVRAHFQALQESMTARKNIEMLQVAIADFEGQGIIHRDRQISGLASFSRRRLDHFAINMEISEEVVVTTLDNFVQRHRIPWIDLLKLDIEGYELSALAGATRMLEEGRIGVIQFEFGGANLDSRTNFQDFYYLMKKYEFDLYIINRYGLWPLACYDEMYEQYRTTNFAAIAKSRKAAKL